MATVLAAVLTMTLNTGTASAATGAEMARSSASTDLAATGSQCAAAPASVEAESNDQSPEMTLLDSSATAAAASQVATQARAAGIAPHTESEYVNQDGVKAYNINMGGVQATSVTFPIEGLNFRQPSNVTYILDNAGQLAQYSESTVVEREDGLLDLNTYRDGVLIHSAEVDPATELSEFSAESAAAKAVDPVTCLMAVLGVGSVVAGTILILCGGSCSVPVTPPTATICAACIGGIAAVGGASIGAVMGCFTGG